MIKLLINLLLSFIFGDLKRILINLVERTDASTLTDEQKRKQVFSDFKGEVLAAGKNFRDSLINLGIELAVSWLKGR